MRFGRKGGRGERVGAKKTIYLHHLWNKVIKEYSKETGMSQSAIVEWCLGASMEEFREKFGLNKKQDVSGKEQEKILDVEEAFKLSKKELVAYAQRSSETRFMRDLYGFGRNESVGENLMRDVEPQGILDRIFNRKHKRDDGWESTGWEQVE